MEHNTANRAPSPSLYHPAYNLHFSPAPFHEQQSNLSTTSTEHGEMEEEEKSIAYRVIEHVKMGPKFSETCKGKLRLGVRIIHKGGRKNIFKDVFGKSKGEKLLKASQCYLSMTAGPIAITRPIAGPIAGTLFISTNKVAFYSDKSITLPSHPDLIRKPYEVKIPITRIREPNGRENAQNSSAKYIRIVTDDSSEFTFKGFIHYEKAFHNLRRALSIGPN